MASRGPMIRESSYEISYRAYVYHMEIILSYPSWKEQPSLTHPRLVEDEARVKQIEAAMAATERYGNAGLTIRAALGSASALAPHPKKTYIQIRRTVHVIRDSHELSRRYQITRMRLRRSLTTPKSWGRGYSKVDAVLQHVLSLGRAQLWGVRSFGGTGEMVSTSPRIPC